MEAASREGSLSLLPSLRQHTLLEGLLLSFGNQFPLPGFSLSKWNSRESPSKTWKDTAFVETPVAIIRLPLSLFPSRVSSVNKEAECEVVSRTEVAKHVWRLGSQRTERRKDTHHLNTWLRKEATRERKANRAPVGILGAMDDPFDALQP